MDIWDWLQNLVNALAVPTFALLIWQIVRAETMRPVEAVHIQVTRLKANRNACIVKASTYGGYVMLSAWIAPIDGCTRLKSEDLRDRTDALANGDTIGIQLEQNREKAHRHCQMGDYLRLYAASSGACETNHYRSSRS